MAHGARGIFALLLTLSMLAGCPTTSIDGVEGGAIDTMPTVVEVTWTTGSEVAAQVRYGEGSSLDRLTPLDAPATEHRALLLGLPPETDASFRVVTEDGDESEVFEVATGALDDSLPTFTLDGADQGHYLVAPLHMVAPPYDGGVAILDGLGRTVWLHPDHRGLYVPRARLARDGSGVIYTSSDLNGHVDEEQLLIWVDWEGREVRTEYVPLMGHDFVEQADGTIVTVAFHEEDGVNSTKLVEIAPDGTQTDTWTARQCFDPEETSHDEMEMGWTFANAMDYDEAGDTYTISFRNLGSIVSVDGATGDCDWAFGGTTNTFEITGSTFEHQHQFQRGEDTMLVFDNDGQAANSRVIEYAMDYEAGTAEEIWSYGLGQWNVVLGDVRRLDDGDTLATWSVYGRIDRITPEGEVEATYQADEGVVIGFTELVDDLYTP